MVKGWNKHTMVKASISIIYCRYIYSHCDMEEEDKRPQSISEVSLSVIPCVTSCLQATTPTTPACARVPALLLLLLLVGVVQCNAMQRDPPSQQHSHGCYTSECLCAPALGASSAPPPLTSHEITSAPLIGLRQNNG